MPVGEAVAEEDRHRDRREAGHGASDQQRQLAGPSMFRGRCAPSAIATAIEPGPTVSGIVSG